MLKNFSDFEVDDYVEFAHIFRSQDWKKFSSISGDCNPLHSEGLFAESSKFNSPIVPLHLVASPLSQIAGMHLPGLPSLYLGHSLDAIEPVYYDEKIIYSAKILSINANNRVLTIRVIALQKSLVVLEATMRVQSLSDSWVVEEPTKIQKASKNKRVVVIGATGAVGLSTVKVLASHDYSLLLQYRGSTNKLSKFQPMLKNCDVQYSVADLENSSDIKKLTKNISKIEDLYAVVYLASPPIDSSISRLVAVNYSAFKEIAEAALDKMLAKQRGLVLYVSSTAMFYHSDRMQDYASSKVMSTSWLSNFDQKYQRYGVRGKVLAPTYINTEFSADFRENNIGLTTFEVANAILDMANFHGETMTIQDLGKNIHGRFGFTSSDALGKKSESSRLIEEDEQAPFETQNNYDDIRSAVRRIILKTLNLDDHYNLEGSGLGVTDGWDSLSQIKVILALENHFKFQFDSSHLTETTSFEDLCELCYRQKRH